MGYRKSLEFLIKDYAIFKYPDSRPDIENSPLSKCINTFIEEPQINVLAKASAWIGNDETHYIRKHESYDISNLKHFISATVAYINYALTYLEASEFLKKILNDFLKSFRFPLCQIAKQSGVGISFC